LLKIRSALGETATLYAGWKGDTDVMECLHIDLSVKHKVDLLKTRNIHGDTVLIHDAGLRSSILVSKCMLDFVPADHKFELLKIQGSAGNTALHRAGKENHSRKIHYLLGGLSVDQKVYLAKIQDNAGNTTMHTAACMGHVSVITWMMSHLHPHHQLELLNYLNNAGETLLDIARERRKTPLVSYLKSLRRKISSCIGRELQKSAKLSTSTKRTKRKIGTSASKIKHLKVSSEL